jgi:CBS domain containing-hemolysin-like protein
VRPLPAALAAVALLIANGFFVAAEFALLATRRARMERLALEGARGAKQALAGLRELSLMLAAAQLGITMASLGLGAVAEPALAHAIERLLHPVELPAGVSHGIALTLALSVVVFFHMVVGEMAPKSWAIAAPERAALRLAPAFRAFALALRPFIRVLNVLGNAVVRLAGVEPQDELAMVHSPSDLMLLLDESSEQGTLAHEQHDLLTRALELSGLDAQAVMTPRRDIVAVPADADADEIEALARRTGRSRLPVYEADLDRIRGVLHVKDLLVLDAAERARVHAGSLARPALVVPESRALEDLLIDMRRRRVHIAVVADEYGSVSGLVSLEDVIEELIGDFEDESDRRAHAFRRRADGAYIVPGSLRPDEVQEHVDVDLPEGEWETMAGLVIGRMQRLPSVGDVIDVDGVHLEVVRMDGHRIVELALTPPPAPNADPDRPQ